MTSLYTPDPCADSRYDAEHLRTAFQPIIDLRDGALVGMEALLRIEVDGRWSLPGQAFVDAAATGRTLELELAAIDLALGRLADLPPGAFLAVNAAPSTILSPRFRARLEASDLQRVVVEITENEVIDDYPGVVEVLGHLRRAGARVAVDDAGAGASSLRHVVRLRPDVVKLDVTLIDEICTDDVQQALVRALVLFTTEIGAALVAEGIEDAHQAPMLRRLGVVLGQGFALGRPAELAVGA